MIEKGIYKHYNGKLYLVHGVSVLSGTEGERRPILLVRYQTLYGDFVHTVRPLAEFSQVVKAPGTPRQRRFGLVIPSGSRLAHNVAKLIAKEIKAFGKRKKLDVGRLPRSLFRTNSTVASLQTVLTVLEKALERRERRRLDGTINHVKTRRGRLRERHVQASENR